MTLSQFELLHVTFYLFEIFFYLTVLALLCQSRWLVNIKELEQNSKLLEAKQDEEMELMHQVLDMQLL